MIPDYFPGNKNTFTNNYQRAHFELAARKQSELYVFYLPMHFECAGGELKKRSKRELPKA